jgi:hypothetical protein
MVLTLPGCTFYRQAYKGLFVMSAFMIWLVMMASIASIYRYYRNRRVEPLDTKYFKALLALMIVFVFLKLQSVVLSWLGII